MHLAPSWPVVALSSLVNFLIPPCSADPQAFYQDDRYNAGVYGKYVTSRFQTTDVEAPRLNFMKPFTNCDDGSYLFIAPRGNSADSRPYILDAAGNLIWTVDHHYGEVYNFNVQIYKEEPYLTFWAGDDAVGGHGAGRYFMFDKHYEEVRQIEAANGLDADLHEFRILPGNTAVISVYEVVAANFSELKDGREDGEVWDWLFQEINLETGELIFQWRATDHVKWSEVYPGVDGKGKKGDPWDFFHGNAVDKDPEGNYLISGRFTRCVYYISGTTGEILWRLGGKENSFRDLSKGKATTFAGQHHTQFEDNYTTITFFDNRADWFEAIDSKSVGTKLKLDTDAMTVELVQTYQGPNDILSISQGSYQTLPNGNVLLGYGFNGVMTEFSPEGETLCDAYMMPSKDFNSGNVQSYRNYKAAWTGLPNSKPALVLRDGVFYMSWLGATEVYDWVLQESSGESEHYDDIAVIRKDGFETHYALKVEQRIRQHARVVALDRHGDALAQSELIDTFDDETMRLVHGPVEEEDEEDEEPFEEPVSAEDAAESERKAHAASVQGRVLAAVGFFGMIVFTSGFVWMTLRKRASKGRQEVLSDEEKRAFLAREGEAGVGLMSEEGEASSIPARDAEQTYLQDSYHDSPGGDPALFDQPSRPEASVGRR